MPEFLLDHASRQPHFKHGTQMPYPEHEQQLEKLAREMIDILLTCDKTHPWVCQHIAINFRGTHDLAPGPLSLGAYMDYIRYLKAQHPGARVLISEDWNIDFDESDENLCAVVWQFARVRLQSEGIVRGRLGMSNWRLHANGVWVCYRYGVWRCDSLALGRITTRFTGGGVELDNKATARA